MTVAARILLEIAPLARPPHRWWASGGWSSWLFCLFDVRRRLALDRVCLRAGFRRGIRVDRTAGPDPRETYEQDPLQQACDLIVKCCCASHLGYLGIAYWQSEATTDEPDVSS